jgi:hypothetical protein
LHPSVAAATGLAVFLGLIYAKKLEWEYSSETICIMIPQLLVLPFTRLKVHNLEKVLLRTMSPGNIRQMHRPVHARWRLSSPLGCGVG